MQQLYEIDQEIRYSIYDPQSNPDNLEDDEQINKQFEKINKIQQKNAIRKSIKVRAKTLKQQIIKSKKVIQQIKESDNMKNR